MERALRKILINYPKRQMGNKMYGGESSHLPLKINQAGVIPAIFASASRRGGKYTQSTTAMKNPNMPIKNQLSAKARR